MKQYQKNEKDVQKLNRCKTLTSFENKAKEIIKNTPLIQNKWEDELDTKGSMVEWYRTIRFQNWNSVARLLNVSSKEFDTINKYMQNLVVETYKEMGLY